MHRSLLATALLVLTPALAAQGPLHPGTGEDFFMATGVNGAVSGGPGNEVKQATAGDHLFVNYASLFTFVGEVPLVAAQFFPTGMPPVGPLPGMWIDTVGGFLIHSGIDPSGQGFHQTILPGFGNTHVFTVPPGLAGTNVMMQALALSGNAANGFFATTDGYVLEII